MANGASGEWPKAVMKDGVVGKRDAGSVVVGLHSVFGNVIDEIVVGMAACVCEINPDYVSTASRYIRHIGGHVVDHVPVHPFIRCLVICARHNAADTSAGTAGRNADVMYRITQDMNRGGIIYKASTTVLIAADVEADDIDIITDGRNCRGVGGTIYPSPNGTAITDDLSPPF